MVQHDDPEKALPVAELPESKISKLGKKYLIIGVSVLAAVALTVGLSVNHHVQAKKKKNNASSEAVENQGGNNVVNDEPIVIVENQDGGDVITDNGGDVVTDESSVIVENQDGGDVVIDVPIVIAAARSSFLPFNDVQLSTFESSALLGYSQNADGTCEELRSDIREAVKQYANIYIMEQSEQEIYYNYDDNDIMYQEDVLYSPPVATAEKASEPVMMLSEPMEQSKTAQGGTANDSESSYGTNNQVEGVDEADKVKSDGTYVYTAYGDVLIVWNAATGKEVTRVVMPPRTDSDDANNDDTDRVMPVVIAGAAQEVPDTLDVEEEPRYKNGDRNLRDRAQRRSKRRASMLWFDPKPKVDDILLDPESSRLGLIVSGYGTDNHYYNSKEKVDALTGENATQFRLYDTSLLSENSTLELIGTSFLRGDYKNARSIGSSAYVVTMSNVEMYSNLGRYLGRYEFNGEERNNSTAYISAATEVAKTKLEIVTNALFDDVTEVMPDGTADCSSVVRVAQFSSVDGESVQDLTGLSDKLTLLNAFGQVHGVDMSASPDAAGNLLITTSAGTFFPSSYDTKVYASDSMIFIAAQGYQYNDETTFILGFSLDSVTTRAVAKTFGQVPGYLLNQYAMDHHKYETGDHLRVATTNSEQWGWGIDPEDKSEESRVQISQASNQLFVLKLSTVDGVGGLDVMSKVGSIEADAEVGGLGLPNEIIYAVRFFGEIGYVVTFERTDPFYTLDLKDPSEPKIVGELKVSGFSSYLHPITSGSSQHILAVGQEADENGQILGVQISLFDVTKLEDPQLLSRYVVEDSKNEYSSSESLYDYHAFRYLTESKKLIIPLEVRDDSSDGSFDGFVVYDIAKDIDDVNGISLSLTVSHVEASNILSSYHCWYSATLPSRSLVFNGKLTTIKGHTVVSTSLATGDELWTYDVDENRDNNDGCYNWW